MFYLKVAELSDDPHNSTVSPTNDQDYGFLLTDCLLELLKPLIAFVLFPHVVKMKGDRDKGILMLGVLGGRDTQMQLFGLSKIR